MAHPTNRNRRKPKQQKEQKVEKASISNEYNVFVDTNLNPATDRMRLGPYSLPSLATVNGRIEEEAKRELRFPQSTRIYKQMSYDSDISSAISLIEAIISRAQIKIECPRKAPKEEKERAEKLNYNLLVMDRPFSEYVSEFLSYLVYGFHTSEKIYTNLDTPVGNFIGWRDFRTISQDTIEEWIFKDSTGELAGLTQDFSRIPNQTLITNKGETIVQVPRKKFLLFRYNTKRNSPEGQSPLRGCYIEWKYKGLIEEFETIFCTKGLGGVLNLGIDAAYLSKAAADPSGPEAAAVQQMIEGAANFHNGDQAFVITPLAYDGSSPLFKTEILETNPPETDAIIKRHSHRILQTFFSDILQLGANGGGSFALAENKAPLLMAGINHHLNIITRVLNHDLIRQTYELNKWDYDARTACRFVVEAVDEVDIDTLSKAVQRLFAVNAMEHTQDIEDNLRETVFGLPPIGETDTAIRNTGTMQTRSGDGMKEGMPNGTGSSVSTQDTSISNTENA